MTEHGPRRTRPSPKRLASSGGLARVLYVFRIKLDQTPELGQLAGA